MRDGRQKLYSLKLDFRLLKFKPKYHEPVPEKCGKQSFVRNGTKTKTPLKQLSKIHLEFVR
jgi:hypothetical protein